MYTDVANQHHRGRTIQISEWLHIRKIESITLYGGDGISHRMFSIEDKGCFLTHCIASIIVGNNNTKFFFGGGKCPSHLSLLGLCFLCLATQEF